MDVTVIGGTGLIGSRLSEAIRALGHTARAASPSTGVNTITGEGLNEAIRGADLVIDASNDGYRDAKQMATFFESSAMNIAAIERKHRTKRHVLLSAVGATTVPGGYFAAKARQERIVANAGVPFTIVRSTPFFEYIYDIIDGSADGAVVHLPAIVIQPIAADDLATLIARELNGPNAMPLIEIGGPQTLKLPEVAEEMLTANEDGRSVIIDPLAPYFGARMHNESLVAFENAQIGSTTLEQWLRHSWFRNSARAPLRRAELDVRFASAGDQTMSLDIDPMAKPTGTGCVECLATGSWWLHLRRCAACGHIGCCDSSPNQHARAHFRSSGHPIVQSFEPGEDWFWDYRRNGFVEGPELVGPTSRPESQPAPGPKGAVPKDWVSRLNRLTTA